MEETWSTVKIREITLAVYVPPHTGKSTHVNRPTHGLVMNAPTAQRDYHFSDGRVLHTLENQIFYLPKGSSYRVFLRQDGGCYAINFDVNETLSCEPFAIDLPDAAQAALLFQNAAKAWRGRERSFQAETYSCLYGIIARLVRAASLDAAPPAAARILSPAEEEIRQRYTDSDLNVEALAALCGISVTYFRRLFHQLHGMSPKEYICSLRIEHARTLLKSQQFTIAQIAELSGFGDPCYFSREFRKRVGETPSACRKGS